MDDLPDEEFDVAFCQAINAGTMCAEYLNDLAWSILDYSLDRHCGVEP
jgi:hypothetical protein